MSVSIERGDKKIKLSGRIDYTVGHSEETSERLRLVTIVEHTHTRVQSNKVTKTRPSHSEPTRSIPNSYPLGVLLRHPSPKGVRVKSSQVGDLHCYGETQTINITCLHVDNLETYFERLSVKKRFRWGGATQRHGPAKSTIDTNRTFPDKDIWKRDTM
ncbi:hypothetical protein ROZALSC1DRAFT_24993 [Rozella allomycis CSF55]|uniref:Uncharacterized protein n=1 Tax=Rozella allomycis (strain CSF55) TaxID=988480 RepID=A0A4P9YBP7_ROZAC|nr:hypothetical protein ROZALSC1DRAFT_24993 [Rozella allomycis CSF55]